MSVKCHKKANTPAETEVLCKDLIFVSNNINTTLI